MIVGGIVGRSLVGSAGNVVALAALAGLRVLLAVSFFICRTDAPVPSLDITPASSSPPPTRNVSALDFSRFSTITLTEPPSALAQSHTKPLQQVDTITSVQ